MFCAFHVLSRTRRCIVLVGQPMRLKILYNGQTMYLSAGLVWKYTDVALEMESHI
jgi:hypothetical protein